MSVRWVVFDAVGTLIYATPTVATAYHEIGRRHGSKLDRDEVAARFRAAFRKSEQRNLSVSSEATEKTRWRRIVAEVLPDVTSPEACFDDLFRYFGKPASWACFDDVEPALSTLAARGVQIAVASNFDARLHSVCDGLVPLAPIQHRIVSSEVGFRKPSRSFYDALLRRIDSSPEEVLMVGDDLENDVRGAEAAGLRAALINRRDVDSLSSDVFTVKTLLELEAVLS